MSWLEACRLAVHQQGMDPAWLEVLRAFGGDDPGPGDGAVAVAPRIVEALSREVDRDQAELFARRYRQVQQLLGSLPAAEGRLLDTFLRHRGGGILAAEPPRALRIRALVDYVFSQAAVVAHADPAAASLEERVRAGRFSTVAEGVRHGVIEGVAAGFGPVHINVLRLRDVRLTALDARPEGDLVALAAAHGAVAAFSGGFFLYSEADIELPSRRTDPVGLLVSRGEVLGPPVFRRGGLAQDVDGGIHVGVVSPVGRTLTLGSVAMDIRAVNEPGAAPTWFNRAWGEVAPAVPSVAIVGRQVIAVGVGLAIPLAGAVVTLPEGVGPAVGDVAVVRFPDLREAIGGGPMLLGPGALDLAAEDFRGSAPPVTFSRDETFDTNLLPRLAAGTTPAGDLVVVAVDGRRFEQAPGLTLRGTARVLAELGCDRAVNLDGGSSKRMVVSGRVVDLPSTEVVAGPADDRVRPVHSAVLVEPI